MRKLFIIALLFSFQVSFAQVIDTFPCTVEIYLLNKRIPVFDSANNQPRIFTPTKTDLQDAPFINNMQLVSYTIERHSFKSGNKKFIKYLHRATIAGSPDPLAQTGKDQTPESARQFALVVNGNIIYGGYFLHASSSLVPPGVSAYFSGNEITFQYSFKGKDPRNSKALFACLKGTNRLLQVNKE